MYKKIRATDLVNKRGAVGRKRKSVQFKEQKHKCAKRMFMVLVKQQDKASGFLRPFGLCSRHSGLVALLAVAVAGSSVLTFLRAS